MLLCRVLRAPYFVWRKQHSFYKQINAAEAESVLEARLPDTGFYCKLSRPFHKKSSQGCLNHWALRQSIRAVRALCTITHRLDGETFSSLQISSVLQFSILFREKARACF